MPGSVQYLFVNTLKNKILYILLSFVLLVQQVNSCQLIGGAAYLNVVVELYQRETNGDLKKEGPNSSRKMVFPFPLGISVF